MRWLRELNSLLENGKGWANASILAGFARETTPGCGSRRHTQSLSDDFGASQLGRAAASTRPKNSVGRNLLNRLTEHADGVLAFALEVGVPFTQAGTGLVARQG